MGEDRDDDDLPRVGSDPPPGSDAYSAPTKVGPMTSEGWMALLKEANVRAPEAPPVPAAETPPVSTSKLAKWKEHALRAEAGGASAAARVDHAPTPMGTFPAAKDELRSPVSHKPLPPRPSPAPPSEPPEAVNDDELESTDKAEIPRAYSQEDEDDAATLLHASARPPSVAPIAIKIPTPPMAFPAPMPAVAQPQPQPQPQPAYTPPPPVVAPRVPTDSRAWPFTPDLVQGPGPGPSPLTVGIIAFVCFFVLLGGLALYFFRG